MASPGLRVVLVGEDGQNVPPEEREQVVDRGFTTASEGTGFGLAIVEGIAEAHGWTVAVGECEGGGARLEFTGVDLA
jgi:signal transduction histidine kinase